MTQLDPPSQTPASAKDNDVLSFRLGRVTAIMGLITMLIGGGMAVGGGVWATAQLVGRLDTLSLQLAALTHRLDEQDQRTSSFWKDRWPQVEVRLAKIEENAKGVFDCDRRLDLVEQWIGEGREVAKNLERRITRLER